MSCLGNDCFVVRQEAREPRLGYAQSDLPQDQLLKLLRRANKQAIDAATETGDTCADGCQCSPKQGTKAEATKWEEVSVDPFTVTDGEFTLEINGGFIETRIVRTPGICKRARIKAVSVALVADRFELTAPDASELSTSRIEGLRELLDR